MVPELSNFPPFPPRDQCDFTACPEDERLPCLVYVCYQQACRKDSSFAERLPPEWRIKYPDWPGKPYLQIPKEIRRQAQPELDPAKLQQVMADAMMARAVPEEAYEVLRSLADYGEHAVYEQGNKAWVLLEISRGMSLPNLIEHLEAYARVRHGPRALTKRPEGAGSYPRKFQEDLNALTAYILLQTLTPAQATDATSKWVKSAGETEDGKRRVKRGLYSTTQKWRAAQERGAFLIKKTIEGKLTATLLQEQRDKVLNRLPVTKSE
jgi:hypothetical protein